MAARYHFIKTGNVSLSHRHKRPDFHQELTENVVIKEFRMDKREVEFLRNLLKTQLPSVGFRNTDLSVKENVGNRPISENASYRKLSKQR